MTGRTSDHRSLNSSNSFCQKSEGQATQRKREQLGCPFRAVKKISWSADGQAFRIMLVARLGCASKYPGSDTLQAEI